MAENKKYQKIGGWLWIVRFSLWFGIITTIISLTMYSHIRDGETNLLSYY